MRPILILIVLLMPMTLTAQDRTALLKDAADTHILPGFKALALSTKALHAEALQDCTPTSPRLRATFGAAFDDWISVSHLRFGPSEVNDRAFALAFWPDPRGATAKTLRNMINKQDAAVNDPLEFTQISIAARGFYALEYLLFDAAFLTPDPGNYNCRLLQAITQNIQSNANATYQDWHNKYRAVFVSAGHSENTTYRSQDEAVQAVFKALTTGLEFTSDARLGRPLGTFDRPRPKRAEARRSGRSLRHVSLTLKSLAKLANLLSQDAPEINTLINNSFARTSKLIERLNDPVFAGVQDPQSRLRVEALQQSIKDIHLIATSNIGPHLGVKAGFNALDGD